MSPEGIPAIARNIPERSRLITGSECSEMRRPQSPALSLPVVTAFLRGLLSSEQLEQIKRNQKVMDVGF